MGTFVTVRGNLPTSNVNLDLTSSGAGTCKGAFIWGSLAGVTSGEGPINDAMIFCAFVDDAGEEISFCSGSEHQGPGSRTDTKRLESNTIALFDGSGTSVLYTATASLITDGVRLTTGTFTSGFDCYVNALLFFGSDVETRVIKQTLPSGTGTAQTGDLAFGGDGVADLCLVATCLKSGSGFNDTITDTYSFGLGGAVRDNVEGAGGIVNACQETVEVDNSQNGDPRGSFRNNRCATNSNPVGTTWFNHWSVTSFAAEGSGGNDEIQFTGGVGGGGSIQAGVLAVKCDNPIWFGTKTTPTSTGTGNPIQFPGMTNAPVATLLVAGRFDTVNTFENSFRAGTFSIAGCDGTTTLASAIAIEDAIADPNTESQSQDTLFFLGPRDDGLFTDDEQATFTDFDTYASGGEVNVNWTQIDSSANRYYWIVGFEDVVSELNVTAQLLTGHAFNQPTSVDREEEVAAQLLTGHDLLQPTSVRREEVASGMDLLQPFLGIYWWVPDSVQREEAALAQLLAGHDLYAPDSVVRIEEVNAQLLTGHALYQPDAVAVEQEISPPKLDAPVPLWQPTFVRREEAVIPQLLGGHDLYQPASVDREEVVVAQLLAGHDLYQPASVDREEVVAAQLLTGHSFYQPASVETGDEEQTVIGQLLAGHSLYQPDSVLREEEVTPQLLTGHSLYQPDSVLREEEVVAQKLDAPVPLWSPTSVLREEAAIPGLLTGHALYQPTSVLREEEVTPGLLAGHALYLPDGVTAGVVANPDLLTGHAFYQPTAVSREEEVLAQLLTGHAFYAPTGVAAEQGAAPGLLTGHAFYAPTGVTSEQGAVPGLLSGHALYQPTSVETDGLQVVPDLLAGHAIYQPESVATEGTIVEAPTLVNTGPGHLHLPAEVSVGIHEIPTLNLTTNTTLTLGGLVPVHDFPPLGAVRPRASLTANLARAYHFIPAVEITNNSQLALVTSTLASSRHVSVISGDGNEVSPGATVTATLLRRYALLGGSVAAGAFVDASLTSNIQEDCGYIANYCEDTCLLEVWNIATSMLSLPAMTSVSENTSHGGAIRSIWHLVRRKFFSDHDWNSNKLTADLVLDATVTPAGRWDGAWTLPACCLRVLYVNGYENQPASNVLWEIELEPTFKRSKLLYTDEATVKIEYISDIENVGLLAPGTAHALGLELAKWLAPRFGKSVEEAAQITEAARQALSAAKSVDSMEQHPAIIGDETLYQARW